MENEVKLLPGEALLSDFEIGTEGTVKTVLGEGKVRRRLFDMGIVPNTDIVMHKKAPLGDPIQITIRGYELSLRKAEAAFVICKINGGNK
jgi:ferrous iron transport protein A